MQIKTGKGPVNLMAVIAIWSLSLSVDLPGLAITPMLSKLQDAFHASQLMAQLVTILPNLLIIPFVLLSGKLSRSNHKIAIIVWGLIIYLAAGILYFIFDKTMLGLLLISCLLGVGCGLLLPFSTGLIADVFVGKYRMKQMGIISAVGNLAVVVATYVVGWLAAVNTTLPFLVYLIPVVSLVLMPFMNKLPKSDLYSAPAVATAGASSESVAVSKSDTKARAIMAAPAPVGHKAAAAAALPAVDADGFSTKGQTVRDGFYVGRSVWLCITYFFWVFVTEAVSYYVPYLMEEYHMSTQQVGTVTAVFFFALFISGLIVTQVLKSLKSWTYIVSIALLGLGFVLFWLCKDMWVFCIASALLGITDGICQPIIYDKATEMCSTQNRSTMALAIILAVNYVAIVVCPFITDFVRGLFGIHTGHALYNTFPFIFDLVLTAVVFVCLIFRKNGFTFGIHKQYYE